MATAVKNSKKKKNIRSAKIRRTVYSILILLIVFLLLRYLINRPQGDQTIAENGVGTVFTPVQKVFTNVTEFFRSWFGTGSSSDSLEEEIEELRLQNELLQIQINSYANIESENERLNTLLEAKNEYETLSPIYAKVIAKDTGVWFETFTINKGMNDGISQNMAVVNADGLVGRINTVGYNYSTVISVIDTRSSIAALIGRTRDNGMMQGALENDDGEVECRMYYLSNLGNVKVGDQVYTSGLDSRFPKGLYIGTVTAVSRSANSADKYVSIRPAVNFASVEEVFVLREQVESIDELEPVPTPTPAAVVTPKPSTTTDIYAYATQSAVDDNAIFYFPTSTPDPNVTPSPTPTPKPTKPVPEAAWLND